MKTVLKIVNNLKNIITVILLLLCFSCKEKNYDLLKGDNVKLKNENKNLQNIIDSLKTTYAYASNVFEENLENEFKKNPDSTIAKYNILIQKYPNSFWQRASEKRIKNIESQRIFWSKEKGWNLFIIPKKPKFIEKTIYCDA